MTAESAVAAALAALSPNDVHTGTRLIDARDVDTLFDDERRIISNARATRLHEFASGRALLRSLVGHVSIPRTSTRPLLLPEGTVASLAHDHEIAVAAAASEQSVQALGIDIEPTGPPDAELAAAVLRPDDPPIDARLAHVMKEATYKAWSNTGGAFLEHHDVRLRVDGDGFAATVVSSGAEFTGRWVSAGGRWLALVVAR